MFSSEELEKLDKIVEKEGVSRSEVIRKLVDRYPINPAAP